MVSMDLNLDPWQLYCDKVTFEENILLVKLFTEDEIKTRFFFQMNSNKAFGA
jgi:hypothetical protein